MPRSFSDENLAAEDFFSIVSSCGFKQEHYSDRFQRRAMTAVVCYEKVLDSDCALSRTFITRGKMPSETFYILTCPVRNESSKVCDKMRCKQKLPLSIAASL